MATVHRIAIKSNRGCVPKVPKRNLRRSGADGSGTNPSDTGLERGNDKCEIRANLRKGNVGVMCISISVERSFPPQFSCCGMF